MYRALDIFTCIYQKSLCELIVSCHKCTFICSRICSSDRRSCALTWFLLFFLTLVFIYHCNFAGYLYEQKTSPSVSFQFNNSICELLQFFHVGVHCTDVSFFFCSPFTSVVFQIRIRKVLKVMIDMMLVIMSLRYGGLHLIGTHPFVLAFLGSIVLVIVTSLIKLWSSYSYEKLLK